METNISLEGLPKPKVKLVGRDGNSFAILGVVKKALQKADSHAR